MISYKTNALPSHVNRRKIKPLLWIVGGEDVHMRIPLVNEMQQRGFRVEVLGTQESSQFEETGIMYHRYNMGRWISPVDDRATVLELKELIAQGKPDIVHAFDTKPSVLVPIAAGSSICKVVRTITGMGYLFSSESVFSRMARPIYRVIHRKISENVDMTIFQNSADMSYFEKCGLIKRGRGVLIRSSGIDVQEFEDKQPDAALLAQLREKYANEDDVLITMITRLVRHKGVLEFLEAASILHKEGLSVKFLLAGPVDSEGRQAINRKELDGYKDVVKYLGKISNVTEILAISDLFVFPSYYREGVPRVLLEAGLSGLPLITTDMPGCRDVVLDGWNGKLVPKQDSGALAEAIRQLAENQQKRNEMGRCGKQYVTENFNLSAVADRYEAVYQRLLAS